MDWNKNRLLIGGVVLLALIGATVWAFKSRTGESPEGDAQTAGAEDGIDDITRDDIDSLEIHRPDSPVVKLAKRGDSWRVVEPVDAEADQTVIDVALDKLDELETSRVVAQNPENHERLEVDDAHGVRVIAREGESVLADLIVGAFGGGDTMVRVHGADTVYAVTGSIKYAFNKELKDWRNRRVLDVEPDRVRAIAFESPAGAYSFVRNDSNEWALAEGQVPIERFGAGKVQSIVASLARMRASDFAESDVDAAQTGLAEGAALARLTIASDPEEAGEGEAGEGEGADEGGSEDGAGENGSASSGGSAEVIVLKVGSAAEDGGDFYLQREGGETVFLVSSFLAEKIRVNLEAFQDPEPGTEEPAEAPPDLGGAAPGGPGGGPGGGEIPPDVMRQIQEQLQRQQH